MQALSLGRVIETWKEWIKAICSEKTKGQPVPFALEPSETRAKARATYIVMGVGTPTAHESTDKTVGIKVINIKLVNPSSFVTSGLFMAFGHKGQWCEERPK